MEMIEQERVDDHIPTQRSNSLIALCILTILGSLFFMLKGLFSYAFLASSNHDRSDVAIAFIDGVYLVELLSCIGSILSAIFMLKGKKSGLLLYQISSITYIILTFLFALFCFLSLVGIPVGLLQFLYIVPSILFLFLYSRNGKYLS